MLSLSRVWLLVVIECVLSWLRIKLRLLCILRSSALLPCIRLWCLAFMHLMNFQMHTTTAPRNPSNPMTTLILFSKLIVLISLIKVPTSIRNVTMSEPGSVWSPQAPFKKNKQKQKKTLITCMILFCCIHYL